MHGPHSIYEMLFNSYTAVAPTTLFRNHIYSANKKGVAFISLECNYTTHYS